MFYLSALHFKVFHLHTTDGFDLECGSLDKYKYFFCLNPTLQRYQIQYQQHAYEGYKDVASYHNSMPNSKSAFSQLMPL